MSEDELLAAAGTLRGAYEAVDWASTSVGAVETWSPALRNVVDLALHTHFPVTLLWGPDFALIYNEAYAELIADKHPAALGRPARGVFPEAWDTIGPMMASVLAGEGANWVRDESVPLVRRGRLEEAYFTFSYSPVRGADGTVEGVMDIATETTRQVIDRRRLVMLIQLRELLATLERAEEVTEWALPLLRSSPRDLPGAEIAFAREPAAESVGGGKARFRLGSVPVRGRDQAVLVVHLSANLAPDESYLAFLRLIASSLGQALDRIAALDAERGIAEALQRSMLTRPPVPEHVELAVRYLPAAERNQIGGDWYDAFEGPHGRLKLMVGDVTGHDQRAAAAMAQVRNLARGVSYALDEPPARILAELDDAMAGLSVGVYATAVLAHVDDEDGARVLRWSNAGHPPPVLISPEGRAGLLHSPPEPLLGLGRDRARGDHEVALEPGSTIVLYTDGLVERRSTPLDERLAWLEAALEGGHALSPEALCDLLLAGVRGPMEDDVALLVLRVARRPAASGRPGRPGVQHATADGGAHPAPAMAASGACAGGRSSRRP